MAANSLISSQQSSSITTTIWGTGEELQQTKAKVVPNVGDSNSDSGGGQSGSQQAKAASVSTGAVVGNLNLTKIQETVMQGVLEKFAEVREQMAKIWEEIFGISPNKNSNGVKVQDIIASNRFDTLLNMSSQTRMELAGSGISVSAGYSQSLSVNIEGTIVAQDGTKKDINVSLSLSQSFMANISASTTNVQSGSVSHWGEEYGLIDPLVIDYDGSGTELTDDTFHFDLDSDGTSDQISTLKKGSGFLALDKNGDGKVNDGSELFGTQSGDGFKDLAQYDKNKDGKIDKNDPIYDKLRIWTPDKDGNGRLIGLGEVGIGAIYLDPKEVGDRMYGSGGDLLGITQKTAHYERVDGSKGNIHHIDLARQNNPQDTSTEANNQTGATQSIIEEIKRLLVGSNINFSGSISFSFQQMEFSSIQVSSATSSIADSDKNGGIFSSFSQALQSLIADSKDGQQPLDIKQTLEQNELDLETQQQTIEKLLLSFQFQRVQLNIERSLSSNKSSFETGYSATYADLNHALLQDLGKESNQFFDIPQLMGNRSLLLG